MTFDPNRTNEQLNGTARERACDEGLAAVRQRAAADAERIRGERERAAEQMRRLQAAYEEAKREADSLHPEPPAPKPRRRRGRLMKTIRLVIAFLIVILAVFLIGRFWPQLKALFAGANSVQITSELPASIVAMMPDEELGYNKIDFQNAVLGQTRDVTELVVMEQDVQVDSQISQALANISLFGKTKTVHSVGTGLYTVNLSKINADAVVADLEKKTVTVTIPHATLTYINIDPEKMTFEDTERAFFAFGDIELTAEQQNILETSVQDTMRAHLSDQELMDAADGYALEKVKGLIAKPIAAVSEDFTVTVVLNAA